MLRGLAVSLAAGPLGACGAVERLASLPEKLHVREIPWPDFIAGLQTGKLRLLEANQMSSVFLLHLYAMASSDPTISKLRF